MVTAAARIKVPPSGLTLEPSGRQRQEARRARAMIEHAAFRAWWPAVGVPLERGARPCWRLHKLQGGVCNELA